MKVGTYLAIVLPVLVFIFCCHLWNNSSPRSTESFAIIDIEEVGSHVVTRKQVSNDHRGQPNILHSVSERIDAHFLVAVQIGGRRHRIVVPVSDEGMLEDRRLTIDYRIQRSGALRVYRIVD